MFNMFSIICMAPRLCKYPFDILKKVMEFFWFSEFFTTFFMLFSCFTVTFPAFSQKNSLSEELCSPLAGGSHMQLNLVIALALSAEL